MTNRIKEFENFDVSEGFLNYTPSVRLNLFTNKEEIEKRVLEYFEAEIKKARVEGFKDAIEKIKTKITEDIDRYIFMVTKICDVVNETLEENIKGIHVKKICTNLYFGTKQIKILFAVEANSIDDELELVDFLNYVEKFVLDKENYVCELMSINKKDVEIDELSIAQEFPFNRRMQ